MNPKKQQFYFYNYMKCMKHSSRHAVRTNKQRTDKQTDQHKTKGHVPKNVGDVFVLICENQVQTDIGKNTNRKIKLDFGVWVGNTKAGSGKEMPT